jgi:HEAT repeat protein
MTTDTIKELAPEENRRLVDFARAFKAAARAVVLYPSTHPAIAVTLGRIADLTSVSHLPTPLRIAVLTDSLLLDGLTPGRSDAAIRELAVLLHNHLIGALTVHPGGDIEAWRRFLVLVGRTPDQIRSEGGIARLWSGIAEPHVELREIDYAKVLRERDATGSSTWSDIVAHCLSGEPLAPDEQSRRLLATAAAHLESLEQLVVALDLAAVGAGCDDRARAGTFVRLIDQVAATVKEAGPATVNKLLDNLGTTVGHLPPDMMMAVLGQPDSAVETPGLIRSVFAHLPDRSAARFVAHHATTEGTSTDRLAQVFRTLVPEDRRDRLLALAKLEVSSAVVDLNGFEERWEGVAEALLTSYSDEPFVSEQYGRELSRVPETAIDVEQVSDDPPERTNAWLESVAASEVRKLDLALVRDLLRIETDAAQWATLMQPVVALIDDLLLVGDFEAADSLVHVLVQQRSRGTTHQRAAAGAIEALVAGPMMRHVAGHLATIEDAPIECVTRMFLALGDAVLTPLAELLIEESDPRARVRLTAVFIAFGASGRREVDRLKRSPNATVRRAAIGVLRQFGDSEALSELTGFLHDEEVQVRREAVRAILGIGTDRAYAILGRALTEGTPAQRDGILAAVYAAREDGCARLFAYILRHVDHRGPLTDLYVRAITALGTLRDPEGIAPLNDALHRGEWWAPRRTTALRDAAAAALARIGTYEAVGVLQQAVALGSRGVRAAARAHLNVTVADPSGREIR